MLAYALTRLLACSLARLLDCSITRLIFALYALDDFLKEWKTAVFLICSEHLFLCHRFCKHRVVFSEFVLVRSIAARSTTKADTSNPAHWKDGLEPRNCTALAAKCGRSSTLRGRSIDSPKPVPLLLNTGANYRITRSASQTAGVAGILILDRPREEHTEGRKKKKEKKSPSASQKSRLISAQLCAFAAAPYAKQGLVNRGGDQSSQAASGGPRCVS